MVTVPSEPLVSILIYAECRCPSSFVNWFYCDCVKLNFVEQCIFFHVFFYILVLATNLFCFINSYN